MKCKSIDLSMRPPNTITKSVNETLIELKAHLCTFATYPVDFKIGQVTVN